MRLAGPLVPKVGFLFSASSLRSAGRDLVVGTDLKARCLSKAIGNGEEPVHLHCTSHSASSDWEDSLVLYLQLLLRLGVREHGGKECPELARGDSCPLAGFRYGDMIVRF